MARRKPHQLSLDLPRGHGGARPGAGRKPKGPRPEVPHLRRDPVVAQHPVHLTVKLRKHRSTLRIGPVLGALQQVLRELHAARDDFRVTAFSLQHDHLHLIAEADGPRSFSSGVRSLMIRLGKRLNQALGRHGRVFADRHHRRVLTTPREVRRALAYVLLNRRRHLAQRYGERPAPGIDEYSSGGWFTGWDRPVRHDPEPAAVAGARTWLGRVGWRRHGLISPLEIPGWRPRGAPRRATQ